MINKNDIIGKNNEFEYDVLEYTFHTFCQNPTHVANTFDKLVCLLAMVFKPA
jgi:hypothetical protein